MCPDSRTAQEMQNPPKLTDRKALERNRRRAVRSGNPALFLQEEAAAEIRERLTLVNRGFHAPAVVTACPETWRNVHPGAKVVHDAEILDLRESEHDLVVHAMTLHWANDPVAQLIQARRALVPDGMFLGALFGGQTLTELRVALAEAETAMAGGLSPRVAPMAEIRELGALLQRAGLALPVADSRCHKVTYASTANLMQDLRMMGETNAMAMRRRGFTRRAVFAEAERRYRNAFAESGGRIAATFEIIYLTGWAPHASQPRAKRPGSATHRLANALGTGEIRLPGND